MSNLSGFIKRLRDIMRNDAGINGDAQRIEQIAWLLFLKVYATKEADWEWEDENYQSIIPEPCRWENWAAQKNGKEMTGDKLLDFVNNTLFPTLKNLPVDADTPIRKAIVQTTFADANNYMKDGVLLVNTSRGALVKTDDLIEGIRARKFSGVGLDVYEEEGPNVYENRSDEILEHSVTARLLSFPNVMITSHQAFFTDEALSAIAKTTLENAKIFERGEETPNEVK